MLDINFVRKNPEKIKQECFKRNVDFDIELFLKIDEKRRKYLQRIEEIAAKKNKTTKLIPTIKDKAEKEKIISEMKEIDKESDKLKEDFKKLEQEFEKMVIQIPNICDCDVPVGKDEKGNKVIKQWGKIPNFKFKPKDHIELGEALDIIDIKKAGEVTGARFNYLKREAALLEFALINYTFDVLTSPRIIKKIAGKNYSAKPFVPVIPPAMIRPEVFTKMGRLSEKDKNERYYLPQDDLYLIGSAEHTLGPLHMNEIIPEKDLPIRYAGFSPSYRREAGSYGKDTRGILRLHQFDKIELESFTVPEDSLKEQNFIVAVQEYLVKALKLPYQLVMLCTGDMGLPDARQIDIEIWMPTQNKYRETHTSDLMTDFQSRRLNTRVKRSDGKIEFVHMNDATAFAIERILIAIMENYQQKNGSIKVPRVLQKYTGFKVIK